MGRIDVLAYYDEELNYWDNTIYIPPYLQVCGVHAASPRSTASRNT
jgi:hypothetical protein